MKSREILVPSLVAMVSLVCTFVLFRFLESFTSAQTPVWGGNIKYGGALGGFVLIYWLLIKAYYKIASRTTDIDIAGDWETETTENVPDGGVRRGSANVRQTTGDPSFSVTMQMETLDDPGRTIAITSLIGYIKDSSIVWVYQSSAGSIGVAMAIAQENRPKELIMRYYDSVFDPDPARARRGSVKWTRKKAGR
jgi:hypothetical protein